MSPLWRAARLPTLILSLSPFVLGGIAGAGARGFDFYALTLALIATAALHIAANWVNDWYDALSGADALAAQLPNSRITATGVLLSGESTITQVRTASLVMLGIGAICAALLALYGRMICAMGVALGAALAISYTAPPIRLAYRGHGLGEVAAVIGYGILPAMVAQSSQGVLDACTILIGAPLGLLAAALLLIHDYLHPEADRQAGKLTPVVAFGADRAWVLLGVILIATYLMLITLIAVWHLSLWTYALILTVLPLGWAWLNMRPPTSHEAIFTAIQYATQTHLIVTVALIAALLTRSAI